MLKTRIIPCLDVKDDLRALKACVAPLNGAISGRALYDGAIDAAEAAKLLKG